MSFESVIEKLPPGPDIDLLLIGKSGNGKSSTGNSILGRQEFKMEHGDESVTKVYQTGYSNIDGRVIKVVDIPGFCDTEEVTEEKQEGLVVKAVSGGLRQFPQGITALILVMPYAARFTLEQRQAIATLKKIMGDDVIRLHTVIVFTQAKSFYHDYGDDADFDTWCRQCTHDMKYIIDECQFRCVAFENLEKDPSVKRSQLLQLVSHIDGLTELNDRYTFEKFKSPCKFEIEKEESENLEICFKESGLIKDDLEKITKDPSDDPSKYVQQISQRVKTVKQIVSGKEKINLPLECLVENVRRYGEAMDRRKHLSLERKKVEDQGNTKNKRRTVFFEEKHMALLDIEKRVQLQEELLKELKEVIIHDVNNTESCLDEQREQTTFGKKLAGFFQSSGNKLASSF